MGFFQDLFGRKPVVPTLPELTLPAEQQKAIQANVAAVPGAAALAKLSQEQLKAMAEFAFPGFGTAGDQISRNIQSQLRGEIPTDVSEAVQRSDAGRALRGGYAGTGMAR